MTLGRLISHGKLLLAAAIMAIATGCTHNNGDIGLLFGSWTLQEIIIDGTTDTAYADNITWNFQNHNLSIMTVYDHHNRAENMGTWEWIDEDRVLGLDFTYENSAGIAGGSPYCPPEALHLPTGRVLAMEVITLTSSDMTLLYTTDDGSTIKYIFTKLK